MSRGSNFPGKEVKSIYRIDSPDHPEDIYSYIVYFKEEHFSKVYDLPNDLVTRIVEDYGKDHTKR